MTETEAVSWALSHTPEENQRVDTIQAAIYSTVSENNWAAYLETFHAAVIAWENPLGGQVELEPENEIENRQAMDL